MWMELEEGEKMQQTIAEAAAFSFPRFVCSTAAEQQHRAHRPRRVKKAEEGKNEGEKKCASRSEREKRALGCPFP